MVLGNVLPMGHQPFLEWYMLISPWAESISVILCVHSCFLGVIAHLPFVFPVGWTLLHCWLISYFMFLFFCFAAMSHVPCPATYGAVSMQPPRLTSWYINRRTAGLTSVVWNLTETTKWAPCMSFSLRPYVDHILFLNPFWTFVTSLTISSRRYKDEHPLLMTPLIGNHLWCWRIFRPRRFDGWTFVDSWSPHSV